MFPLYPKLRLTARELIGIGLDMMPVVRLLLSQEERPQLNAEVFFLHGGDYQKQLLALGLDDPQRIERFVSEVSLPRYVGIVRFQLHDAALVDIVCDTTDIRRDYPRHAPVLAVFPFIGKQVASIQQAVAPWHHGRSSSDRRTEHAASGGVTMRCFSYWVSKCNARAVLRGCVERLVGTRVRAG